MEEYSRYLEDHSEAAEADCTESFVKLQRSFATSKLLDSFETVSIRKTLESELKQDLDE